MIANRFIPLETNAAGTKARDAETAQTVMLVPVTHLDARVVGIFHPALVTVFAIVEHNGQTLAATEFVHGRPLGDLFGGEPCHPRRAAEIISELADGVAELHARGLAHGQITLKTSLLTAKGKARLTMTSVDGGDEHGDVRRLRQMLVAIGGRSSPDLERAESAAVLAALLRS